MSDEYIKRKDVLAELDYAMGFPCGSPIKAYMMAYSIVEDIPSADVVEREVVKWKYHETCVADESKLLQELYAKMIQKTDSSLTTHQLVYWGDVKDVIEKFFLIKRSSNLFRLRGNDDE